MEVSLTLVTGFALIACAAVWMVRWLVKPVLASRRVTHVCDLNATFSDPLTGQVHRFPNVFEADKAAVRLSLVVPAYDEQHRLPAMLNDTLRYLDERRKRQPQFTFEVIIVDDGSSDRTFQVAMKYVAKNSTDLVRVLRLPRNCGKGAAIQQGMLHARGEYMLMVDADAATRISDLEALEKGLEAVKVRGYGIAVGSRAHLQEKAVAKRHWLRNFLMYGFHLVVAFVAGTKIRDTQCGFKLFTRAAARDLFANQRLMRWAFDVEILMIASMLSIPVAEVAVHWTEIPGSKLSVIESAFTMFRDLVIIRACYLTGFWRIREWQAVYHDCRKYSS